MRLGEMPERERERERWNKKTPTRRTWITFDTLDIVSRKLIREEEKKKGREVEFVSDSEKQKGPRWRFEV